MPKRSVIVHYHLFKNAGTSVDKILKENFGEDWIEVEGPNNKRLVPKQLAEFILTRPNLKAVSSHTAVFSMPKADELSVIPLVMMRHPIDRIRSAYHFERHQKAETPGAKVAKEGDFNHYLNWRLSTPTKGQISNFHAGRLKDFFKFTPAKQMDKILARSIEALDHIPYFGLVEKFEDSMTLFRANLIKAYPSFKVGSVHENSTRKFNTVEENLQDFYEEIGPQTYKRLLELNSIDLALYRHAKLRFKQHMGAIV